MRLICPNCGAQYEVDERVIPDAGRDVQCSNCGHAWFQRPASQLSEADDEAAQALPGSEDQPEDHATPPAEAEAGIEVEGEAEAEAEAGTGAGDDVASEAESEPERDDSGDDTSDDGGEDGAQDTAGEDDGDKDQSQEDQSQRDQGQDEAQPEARSDHEEPEPDSEDSPPQEQPDESHDDEAPAPEEPTMRPLDDGVRDILREEAERETEARSHERAQIETQDELGLDEQPGAPDGRGVAAQERMARLRGLDVEDEAAGAPDSTGARRDLLPDIEEINSSLESIGSEEVVDDFADAPARKGGFSRGFVMMIVLAAIIITLYIYAPLIGEKIPALAPYMEAYVGVIDKIRAWLDAMVQLALSKLQAGGGEG